MTVMAKLLARPLQILARYAPGATTLRVTLHRLRGVTIGPGVFIGTDALIETSKPHQVYIGANAAIGIRSTIIAHFRGNEPRFEIDGRRYSVCIEEDAFIGPGVLIMPNVRIGRGAVVAAGSVVTRSVKPMTMVQGNPAVEIAVCGVPLGLTTPIREFTRQLRPIDGPRSRRG